MKKIITIFLFIITAFNSSAVEGDFQFRDSLVKYATSLKGVPYLYGGTSQKGFDCSGFVYYVFKHFSQRVPRTSSQYQTFGKKIDLEDCQPGDVMVFTGTNANIRKPGHLGIVVKNENGKVEFVHASSSKRNYGVTITSYNQSGYVKRFLSVINVFN